MIVDCPPLDSRVRTGSDAHGQARATLLETGNVEVMFCGIPHMVTLKERERKIISGTCIEQHIGI